MADASTSTDPSLWSFVGPAAQIGAGLFGSLSSSGAAAGGYNTAAGTIQGGLNRSYGALSPYSSTGSAAESALASLYGLGGQAPNYSAFMNSPGYQFQVEQGDNAINRAAAASGNAFSTTTLAQLGRYNSGLAATQYQQYLQNLYGLTQTGAGAAGALGSQAIQGASAVGNAQVGAGVSRGVGTANASGVVATALGRFPWQQVGNYFSGSGNPDTSGIGSYADAASGSAADYINSNFTAQPIDVSGDVNSALQLYGAGGYDSPGTTTYFGDNSGP